MLLVGFVWSLINSPLRWEDWFREARGYVRTYFGFLALSLPKTSKNVLGGSSLNIKQLRYVTAIISTGSFSAAAAREGVSVQAVSKAMSELEGEMGESLFDRASSGVRATPLGRSFAARARHVLKEYDALEQMVHTHGREPIPSAPLSLGFCCPHFNGVERLASIIVTMSKRILRRDVELTLLPMETFVDDLRAGRVDALITLGMIKEPGVISGCLGTMSPSVQMAPTNPLAEKSQLTMADINSCPVLITGDFEHYNQSVCEAYVERGMTSELVTVTSLEEQRTFMEEQNGLAFVVGGPLFGFMRDLVMKPIVPEDRVPVPICLSSMPGADVSYVELRHLLAETELLG